MSVKYKTHIFKEIHNPDLERHWKRIEEETDCFPQMYYEWCEPWWRLQAGNRKLHIVTVKDDNQAIVGIAPMCIEKRFGMRILRSVPPRGIDFYSFLIEDNENYSEIVACLMSYLQACSAWQIVHLYNVNNQTPVWQTLQENSFLAKKLTDIFASDFLGMTFEEYLSTLSRKTRHNYHYYMRRLEKTGNVTLECIEDAAGYMAHAEEMRRIYEMRWQDDYWLLPDDIYYQFLSEAIQALFVKKKVVLYLLKLDHQIISFRLGFIYNKTFYDWKVSHDPGFDKFSPGILIIGKTIEELISRGYTQFNHMAGDYGYKRSWATDGAGSANYELFAFGRSIRARLYVKYRIMWRDKLKKFYYTLLEIRWVRAVNRWIQAQRRRGKS